MHIPDTQEDKVRIARARDTERASEVMWARIRGDIERRHRGQHVVFDISTGRYVLGTSHIDALTNFWEKFGVCASGSARYINP